MAILLDLPNELLCEILEYLEHHRQHLLAFSRSHPHLHAVAQPFLFRHANYLSTKQRILFSSSLERQPVLGRCVQSYGPVSLDMNDCGSPKCLCLFDLFPSLKRVQFELRNPMEQGSTLPIPRIPVWNQIEDVTISSVGHTSGRTSGVDVSKLIHHLFYLEKIQTLNLSKVNFTGPLLPSLQESTSPALDHSSNLTTVRLHGTWSQAIAAFNLKMLMERCQFLRILECTDLIILENPRTALPASHFTLNKIFSQAPSTLRSLRLTSFTHIVSHLGCGALLETSHSDIFNLSEVPSLRDLDINAECLFRAEVLSKSNLYCRLPSQLENLSVNTTSLLDCTTITYANRRRFHTAPATPFDYQWLYQFPAKKHAYLPNLRRVTITVPRPPHITENRIPSYAILPSHLHQSLMTQYRATGIELKVKVDGNEGTAH